MSGKVLVPGDGDYDDARRIWNAEIDRRPAVIARCTSAADVAAAVTVRGDRRAGDRRTRWGARHRPGTQWWTTA